MSWDPAGVTSGNMDGSGGTWSASATDWFNGNTAGNTWSNTTNDTAYFGSALSSSNTTVTISGVVNVGAIVFNNPNNSGFTFSGGTINGPSGGTLFISSTTGNFFTADNFSGVTFTGASTYQIDGSKTNSGSGFNIGGSTFAGNLIIGNGSDVGSVLLGSVVNPTPGHSVTINSGWDIYANSGGTYTVALTLSSLGAGQEGGLTLETASPQNWSGPITLGADGAIVHASKTTYTVSSNISGSHNLYLGSWGTMTAGTFNQFIISGANTYTGATLLMNAAGNTAGAINQPVVLGANNTLPTGTTIVIGLNPSVSPYAGIAAPNTAGWVASDAAFDLHGFNQTVAGLAVGAGRSGSNQWIGNYANGTTSTLTITGTTTPTSANGGFAGNITDHFGVSGSTGILALTVGPGGFLTLTGSDSYTGATTVNAGTLKLDFSVAGAPASNIVNAATDSSALVLGAGTLNLVQKASTANTQQFNGMTVNAGQSSIVLTGTTGNTLALNLGAITDNVGGAVDFTLPSGTQSASNGIITTNANDAYGLLGGWATVSGTSFAAVSAGNIVAFSNYENANDVSTWGATGTNGVISNTGAFFNSLGSSGTIGALLINAPGSGTANLGGNTLTIADGAILVSQAATGGQAISSGTLTSGTTQLTVDQNASGTLTIGASIANNGASSVAFTKNGVGTLLLSASNSYSGGTTINSGTLQMGNANALGAAGSPLTINSATLDLAGASVTSGALSGLAGGLITNSGAAAVLTVSSSGTSTYNGSISDGAGTVGLTKAGAGTLTLSASNNYSGNTAINGGVLSLGNAYALGATGVLSFGGGTLQYSSANQVDYSGVIASSGSAISIDTNGQSVTFASALASSNTGGLTKVGAGTLTLTGTENYTGPTTISTGTLQLGNGVTGGAIASGSSILDNGALIFNEPGTQTYAGNITGTGKVNNLGAGVQILTGSNSYSGGTVLNAGELSLGSTYALGSSGNITFSGGALQYSGSNTTDYSGRIVSSGSAISIDTNGQNVTFGTALASSNTGGLTKSGSGTLLLNVVDSFSGVTTVNGGTLQLGVSGALPQAALVVNTGATFDLDNHNTYSNDWINGITGNGLVTSSGAGTSASLGMSGNNWVQTFGGSLSHLNLDFRASGATWTLSGSSNLTDGGSGYFNIGNVGSASASTIIVTGTVTADQFNVGRDGAGNLILNGGLLQTNNGVFRIGWGVSADPIGSGTFTLTSGTVIGSVVDSAAAVAASPPNAFLLNGGVLETQRILVESNATSAPFTFTMNGGLIYVTGANTLFQNGGSSNGVEVAVQIGSGGGFINTNGFNSTSQRPISDVSGQHGMLTKLGAGTLTLSNTGSWSGGTAINGGDINLNNPNALLTTGTISFGGGTLQYSGSNQFDYSGVIANSGSAISIDTNSQNITFATPLAGSNTGGLAKLGAGQLILTASNAYSGGTTVTAGTLQLQNANALGAPGGNLAVNGGTLDMYGNSFSVGALSGTGSGVITTSVNAAITLTSNSATSGTYSGIIQNGSGQIGLTKSGSGTLGLSGADTYSGVTNINGGVIAMNNASALGSTSAITFGGGTLRYVGTNTDYSALIVNSGSAVSIDTGSQTVTFGTQLAASNTGGLTVSSNASNGVLILPGAQVYPGVTTINSGALWLGDGFNLDDSTLTSGTIVDNGSLVYQTAGSESYSGSISGSGTVALNSKGLQTLTGSNSYSGGTNLSGSGTMNYGNVNALGTGPVTFAGSAALQAGAGGTLANNVVVNPSVAGTFDTQANSVTVSGTVSGSGILAKVGSGTLTLSNSNSNTGGVKINGGILALANSGALGTAGAISFGGGTLQYSPSSTTDYSSRIASSGSAITIDTNGQNVTFNTPLANSNTGGLTKNGSGTLTLSETNNYSGVTTVNAGTLQLGSNPGFLGYSLPATLLVVNSGGTVDFNNQNTYANWIDGVGGNGLITSSGAGTNGILGMLGSNWTQTFGGTLTHISVDFRSANALWTLSGSSNLTDSGNGQLNIGNVSTANASTVILTGTMTADFICVGRDGAGTLILNGGLLQTSNTTTGTLRLGYGVASDPAGSGTFILNSGTAIAPIIDSAGLVAGSPSNAFQLNGGVLQTGQVLIESGTSSVPFTFTMNGGTIVVSSAGTLFKNGGSSNGAEVAVQIGAGGGFINTNGFNTTSVRPITDGTAGPGAFTKLGAGTLTLSSSNTYTGTTTVSAGTLLVSGSLSGTLSTSVASGATLEVDGLLNHSAATTINGTLRGTGSTGPITANGGTLAPGLTAANNLTSEGVLTAAGSVNLSSTTNFSIRLGMVNGNSGDNDQLTLSSGTVSLAGANLQLTIGSFLHNPAEIGFTYVIINGGAGGTGTAGNLFAQGNTYSANGYTFNILYASDPAGDGGAGNDVVLQLTAIPEPGTWASMIGGFGMLLVVQRMRRKVRD